MPYLTPDNSDLSESPDCRQLTVAGDLWYLVSGALSELCHVWNWEQSGTATPQECADYFKNVLDDFGESICGGGMFNNANELELLNFSGSTTVDFYIPITSFPSGVVAGTAVLLDVRLTSVNDGTLEVVPMNGFSVGLGAVHHSFPASSGTFLQLTAVAGATGIRVTISGMGLENYSIIVDLTGYWS